MCTASGFDSQCVCERECISHKKLISVINCDLWGRFVILISILNHLNLSTFSVLTTTMFLSSEFALFPLLLIWSLCVPDVSNGESLKDVYAKECDGTNYGLTYTHDTQINRYRGYERKYGNCTRVRENLEIVFIQLTDDQYDFSFLANIREVDGYVLIYGNHVPKIRLTKLRVIRGYDLYTDSNGQEFGLYVAQNSIPNDNSVGLEELQLPSLVEILQGLVMFKGNSRLCFGENTINWRHILLDEERIVHSPVSGYEKINCSNSGECHENCSIIDGQRFCWGPGADMCQTINTCGGNNERCTKDNKECHSQCVAGCNKENDEKACLSCRQFARGSECISNCSAEVPKKGTHDRMSYVIPADKYSQGSKCVKTCDAGFTLQDGHCVHSCKRGYMVKNNICIQCEGDCPKTCRGTDGLWIKKVHLPSFTGCKTVEGSLDIFNESFTGDPSISVDDLERLSDIEVITEQLVIQAWRPDFTSLNFLRNLQVINGVGVSVGLEIYGTSLKSLGLRSLRRVEKSIVIMNNTDLCYADSINWTKISTGTVSVRQNKNSLIRGDENLVCSPVCQMSDGCFGPGDDECFSCPDFQLMDHSCSPNCSTENGFYTKDGIRGNLECRPCHSSCIGNCSGDGPEHCHQCRNLRHQNTCVDECPPQTYPDSNRVCQPCNRVCDNCTGNSAVLGKFGCNDCQSKTIRYEDKTGHCILSAEECDNETYLKRSESIEIYTDPGITAMTVCRKCHPECIGCNDLEPIHCHRCRNNRQNTTANVLECVSNCSEEFYYAGDRLCLPCHSQCSGCNGSGNYDCKKCKFVRINPTLPPGWTEKDIGNNSNYRPYCDNDCPIGQVKNNVENQTEVICSIQIPRESWAAVSAASSVIAAVLVILIIALVIYICIWRRQKLKQLREKILVDEIPMITSSGAKPDMSSIRLIKESELRRGNVIGSGAFGTVYKGIWIPDKEKVKIPVAIKVLQEKSDANSNMELMDEARIMATVCHPNCVRILAVCMTAQMMLITQLMPLGCLLDYVRKERSNIGSRALLLWSVQIAKGMKYLEDLGIVHRDLAARNVLVYSSNQVKITDFGLAKLLDYEEEEFHSDGGKMPIKWLALECIQHRIYTHKSDVWSYGVTLWEMFSYGQRPYENLQARQVPHALEKGERLPQPEVCTIDVYMILIKCWMLDVDSRPTFSDLVEEFTRMAADPGRFLVIQGDKLMRLPSQAPDAGDLIRLMSLQLDDSDLTIMSAEDYLRPKDLEEAEDNNDFFSSDKPKQRPLTSIQEGVVYENSETVGARATEMEDDHSEGKLADKPSQCLRQMSQRYVANPCQGSKDDDKPGGQFVVDEDGYLPPQSIEFQPSYLDLVYHSTHDNPYSNENPELVSTDTKVVSGISKDNLEYYDKEDSSHADCVSKTDKLNASANADEVNTQGPIYCNTQHNEYVVHL